MEQAYVDAAYARLESMRGRGARRAAYSDVRAGGTLKPGSNATSPGT